VDKSAQRVHRSGAPSPGHRRHTESNESQCKTFQIRSPARAAHRPSAGSPPPGDSPREPSSSCLAWHTPWQILGRGAQPAGTKLPQGHSHLFRAWSSSPRCTPGELRAKAWWLVPRGVSNFCAVLSDLPSLLRMSEAIFPSASSTWFLSPA
jgi:hypothetical protein